jgi:hypothetical protein
VAFVALRWAAQKPFGLRSGVGAKNPNHALSFEISGLKLEPSNQTSMRLTDP